MISHSVEISNAGGVVGMVRGPIPWSVFIFILFLFLYHIFFVRYKNWHAALAIA